MSITDIREYIRTARLHEERTGEFRRSLEQRLPALQSRLALPEENPLDSLMEFIQEYIDSVPGSLTLVTAVSKQMGFHEYAAPFLHLAEDYFLSPPAQLPGGGGLEALMDEAFLAHRLLEEVNDHHFRYLQRPLLPLDMTEANLIAHHLLGDELATRLEQLVQFAALQLLEREHIWEKLKSLPGSDAPDPPLVSSAALTGSPQQVRLRLSA